MRPLQTDLSIFEKFKFERPPVGVKFLFEKPEGIKQLDKSIALCEMIKEAQQAKAPFYMTKENEACVGKIALGMEEVPLVEAGLVGQPLGIYQEPRANNQMYQYAPKFKKGIVNYVVFSPLDKLNFEPDLLILLASVKQAEIVLRAMSYATGEMWETRGVPAFACSFLYVYPFLSGKVNYTVTGLTFGGKAKELFPEGQLLMSIPYKAMPNIIQSLKEMEWVPPSYTEGREKFLVREHDLFEGLMKKYQNP
ncbi:MAG: DUF169 domain-containing protein [Dehalococcoidia bacterium]|nr:DUF169 domain-containing protein [Dehalococcoidia bacterium]